MRLMARTRILLTLVALIVATASFAVRRLEPGARGALSRRPPEGVVLLEAGGIGRRPVRVVPHGDDVSPRQAGPPPRAEREPADHLREGLAGSAPRQRRRQAGRRAAERRDDLQRDVPEPRGRAEHDERPHAESVRSAVDAARRRRRHEGRVAVVRRGSRSLGESRVACITAHRWPRCRRTDARQISRTIQAVREQSHR